MFMSHVSFFICDSTVHVFYITCGLVEDMEKCGLVENPVEHSKIYETNTVIVFIIVIVTK